MEHWLMELQNSDKPEVDECHDEVRDTLLFCHPQKNGCYKIRIKIRYKPWNTQNPCVHYSHKYSAGQGTKGHLY